MNLYKLHNKPEELEGWNKPYVIKSKDRGSTTFKNGIRISIDDKPATIAADGTQYWFNGDKYHRENGPAIIRPDGTKEWWVNNQLHNETGPAVTWENGYSIEEEYWLNDEEYSKEDWKQELNNI